MGWGGLGKYQRLWVLERDGYCCQHFSYDDVLKTWLQCQEIEDLHVHHIFPVRWMRYHYPWIDPHRPHNLITLCGRTHHLGQEGVHPEMYRALMQYRDGDKLAFDDAVNMHRELTEHGEVYWDTTHDLQYIYRARSQTAGFKKKFPEKRRRADWKRPRGKV